MYKINKFNNAFLLIILAGWLALFFSGLSHYNGSTFLYVTYSLVSLLLLASAFVKSIGFGYIFFATFLWLGLWFKLTVNFLLLGFFPFGEAVGNFDCSAEAWDRVLLIITLSMLGVLFSRLLCLKISPLKETYQESQWTRAPLWYPSKRKLIWLLLILTIIIVSIFNYIYGVHQIGMTPQTIFPWPGNALISWFLNIGAAIAVSTLISWDIAIGENLAWPSLAILFEALVTGVSIFSRSTYPFHTIPQIFALSIQRNKLLIYSTIKKYFFVVLYMALFVISIAAVSLLRDRQYIFSKATALPLSTVITNDSTCTSSSKNNASSANIPISSFRPILFHQLVINRWIGLEGILAVSSYPDRSMSTIKNMLLEKRELGKATAYQTVSNSAYQAADEKNQFASMPGITGFLYFGGTFWIVFIGMMIVTLFIIFTEILIFKMTKNPLICSLYGILLANTFAQFGTTPRQDIPQYLMFYLTVITLWGIQKFSNKNIH